MTLRDAAWQHRNDLVDLDTYVHSMNQRPIPANVSHKRGLTGWQMYGILLLALWAIYIFR